MLRHMHAPRDRHQRTTGLRLGNLGSINWRKEILNDVRTTSWTTNGIEREVFMSKGLQRGCSSGNASGEKGSCARSKRKQKMLASRLRGGCVTGTGEFTGQQAISRSPLSLGGSNAEISVLKGNLPYPWSRWNRDNQKERSEGISTSEGRTSNDSRLDRSNENHPGIEEGTSRNSLTHCIPLTGYSPPSHPIQNQSPIGFDRSALSGHAAPIIHQDNETINTIHNVANNQSAKDRKGMDLLLKAVAPGAFHNSKERHDPPKCHPSTRVAILRKIRLWVEELEKTHDFMWLHASERGDAKRLVPTLVYQMCQSMPEIRSYVEDVIEKDPLVVLRSVEAQFKGLIIEPMERALMDPFNAMLLSRPRLIIIDGLDECAGRDVQSNLLRVLSTNVKTLPVRLLFLIASRPEPHIRHAFDTSSMAPMTMPLALDESYLPSNDIEIFLLAKFEEIKETHPLRTHPLRSFLDPAWPSQSEISSLVEKASGQFIYASTVIKYVNSPRHRPVDRLNIIHEILTPPKKDNPFAALDALYSFIFSCVEDLEATLRMFSQAHNTGHFYDGFIAMYGNFIPMPKKSCMNGFNIVLTSFQRVSCRLFVHHCPRAKGTVVLLEELSNFDFFTFLSLPYGEHNLVGSKDLRTQLPSLFRWFQQQDLRYPKYQLHRGHLQSWDSHIRSQLGRYITAPFGREFITCLTIPGVQGLKASVFSALPSMDLESLEDFALPEDYREMISYFLTDPIRAKDFHVGSNSYTNLAICFARSLDGIISGNIEHRNPDDDFVITNLPFILSKASGPNVLSRELTSIRNVGVLDNHHRALADELCVANAAIRTYLSRYKTSNVAIMKLRIMQYLRAKSERGKHTILRSSAPTGILVPHQHPDGLTPPPRRRPLIRPYRHASPHHDHKHYHIAGSNHIRHTTSKPHTTLFPSVGASGAVSDNERKGFLASPKERKEGNKKDKEGEPTRRWSGLGVGLRRL
ncbi:hypothetical protein B0H34DRAFT_673519 [Crassisporium funariophilum]|nr:hypothetical protein B0H34DRAFT_673519 [Crassisporium funariophilum]